MEGRGLPDLAELKELLLSLQAPSGAFESTVHAGNRSFPDYNGFVTALVLRELEAFAGLDGWSAPLGRALDFLEECQSPSRQGLFFFWPAHRWPPWAPRIPEDCDCTATIASELLHYGRIGLDTAHTIVSDALLPYRLPLSQASPGKPWIRPGAFLTWHHLGAAPNPVDVVVNVNVAAFLAQTGCTGHASYREVCRMIFDGISWCARRWEYLERLSPYYPEGWELVFALHNALRRGAADLNSSLEELQRFNAPAPADDSSKILFSMADRSTVWSSTALWAARCLARDFSPPRSGV
jgi:hypothetical protein